MQFLHGSDPWHLEDKYKVLLNVQSLPSALIVLLFLAQEFQLRVFFCL